MPGCGAARANVLELGTHVEWEGSPCGWSRQAWGEWRERRWESHPMEVGVNISSLRDAIRKF